jgi:formylglycine-generating enzyme required for sulfatase activity
LVDVADALDFMHSEGLVHRDVKPGNILFNASGRAYLGDFGISKVVFESDGDELSGLTGTGTLIGTAEYMPPEILLPSRYGEVSDGRSDQYALAVTVYEMLSGRPPFQGDTIGEVSVRLATEEAVPLHVLETRVPESLSAVVGQALQKQPEDRYASCEAFASSFTAAVEEHPGVAVTKPAAQRQSPGAAVAGGRQVTQLEASGPSRTPTIQKATPDATPRGTVPENVYVPVSDGLPETLADRGETVQERRPPLRTERFWRVVDDLPRHRLFISAAILLIAVVLLGFIFSGGPEDSVYESIDPAGPDPTVTGVSAGPPPPDTTNSIDPSGPDPNAMGPSTDGASLPEGKSAQASIMEVTNSIGMKLRLIPAGKFMMGSPGTESYRSDNETQHRVSITKPFYMGETEVTQEQYQKVMGTNPSQYKGPQNPVEKVSWAEAVEFCRKLSAMPAEKTAGHVYRLPTEAEWEYACRSGTTTAYGFGDDASRLGDYGWFEDNSDSKTHPVGEKKPNAWGLYDMHGNVWEWCQDRYGAYPSGSATDPTGATSGSNRVYRGGSWYGSARNCRSADRYWSTPEGRDYDLGFRVLRSSIK